MSWACEICGVEHEELPLAFGAEPPWRLLGVTDADYAARVEESADVCVVDEKHHFVRGQILLPIRRSGDSLAWSVWVSVSPQSFGRMIASWEDEERDGAEPCFGWLMTRLPGYPETLHLRTMVHARKPGFVPLLELEPTDHPLAVEQREGIPRSRAAQIAHLVLAPPIHRDDR